MNDSRLALRRKTRLLALLSTTILLTFGCRESTTGNGMVVTRLSVDPIASPTSSTVISVTGRTTIPGSLLRIEGGEERLEIPAETSGLYRVDVALRPNRVNRLVFTEVFAAGGLGAPVSVSVIQDGTPPEIHLDFPPQDETIYAPEINVSGRVGDILSGFAGLQVDVAGQPAIVNVGIGTNGTFDLPRLTLVPGDNVIDIVATDAVGNQATAQAVIHHELPVGNILDVVSGQDQTGFVGELLPNPIQVKVTRPDGTPFAGKVVTFEVARSDGRLSINGADPGAMTLCVMTDADGLAHAYWRLGSDAGCGNHRVQARSLDVTGVGYFCASARSGAPVQISVGSGENQVVRVSSLAPEPLRVWVSDGNNGLEGIDVEFSVERGGGRLIGMSGGTTGSVLTTPTARTGHAEVRFEIGTEPDNNVVSASFPGLMGPPARFSVRGIAVDAPSTTLRGTVLDNAMQPLEGVSCFLSDGTQELARVATTSDGRFLFEDLSSSGLVHLHVDGKTAVAVGRRQIKSGLTRFPPLEFEILLHPNAENVLPQPVLLPRLQSENNRPYDGSQDVTLGIEGIDGISVFIEAGSVIFSDGTQPSLEEPLSSPVLLSLNQVHHNDVPMPIPDGAAPPFAWTLQPAGLRFSPPARIIVPNISGLPAGSIAYILSFDHDTQRFEIVSTASVTRSGESIVSDPGDGLSASGWGCNCPPYTVQADCKDCQIQITSPAQGDTADRFIDATPQMPMEQLKAKVGGLSSGTVTFDWSYNVNYDQNNITTDETWTGRTTAQGSAETTWTVPFDKLRGGDVTITVKATLPDEKTCSITLKPYRILGTNPTEDAVKMEIGSTPWYAQRIARHETACQGGYKQFKTTGEPLNNKGDDGGAGIFQITPPSEDDVWNWKANVASGHRIIREKQDIASDWWTGPDGQLAQWMEYNMMNPQNPAPPPSDVTYGSVTYSHSPTGDNQYPFTDALAIKCFNGCSPHFLSWGTGMWNPPNDRPNDYVQTISTTTP